MCGIVGQFNFQTGEPVAAEAILRMTKSIAHRGPDDEGSYLSGPVGLGFRRLAILDLSAAGHQPMSDESGVIFVVFNGEIYNFRALRRELESHGCRFVSECDTEVIVQGYKQWGEAVLQRLDGMFGLAIWDEREQKLLVARDAMGIKPVYYALQNGTLFFGSELRPVLAGLHTSPAVDSVALNLFLRYRYTPAPLTIHRDVRKLAAGEMLRIHRGKAETTRWYRYAPEPFQRRPKVEEAAEKLLELYKSAVKSHLMSDVPVGLLLSGGVDSGLLLGLMRLYGDNWPTFTVGYGASFEDDELSDAAESARLFQAKNTSVQLDRASFEQALPRIVDILEEPIASSSIVPMYFVCERARQDVKVVLLGQGPDELFGGYSRHLGVRYGSWWRALPLCLRGPLSAAANALPRRESLKRAVHSLGVEDRMHRYQAVFSIQPGAVIDGLFRKDVLPTGAGDRVLDCWADLEPDMRRLDELNGFQHLELRSSLPDELLMYGDKLSMAHGLEARVPYLDRQLVEYVQCLDASYKVRHGSRKYLHRRVCGQFLPPAILRRKKRGFAVNVVDSWFNETMRGKMIDYLLDESSLMYRVLEPRAVKSLLDAHVAGRNDNHKVLFSLVVLEQWMRTTESKVYESRKLAEVAA